MYNIMIAEVSKLCKPLFTKKYKNNQSTRQMLITSRGEPDDACSYTHEKYMIHSKYNNISITH